MEGIFYQYNNNFIKSGEIFKDKLGTLHRFNKNENGELRGGQIQTDKNGNLLLARYIDDNSNVQTTVYKNGEVYSKFQEKLINGKFIKSGEYEQYENGIVVKKGFYLNGEEHGEWYMLNDKKNKIIGKKYSHGKDITEEVKEELKRKITGLAEETVDALVENDPIRAAQRLGRNIVKLFNKNKKEQKIPQIKINFQETPALEENKTEKCYSSFFADGSPKIFAEEAILKENNLKFKGKYIEHFDNGKIKITANYNSNNKLNGLYREFHDNGQLKYQGEYVDGEKNGFHIEFDSYGKQIKKENYDLSEKRKENFISKEIKNKEEHDKEERKKKFIKNIESIIPKKSKKKVAKELLNKERD